MFGISEDAPKAETTEEDVALANALFDRFAVMPGINANLPKITETIQSIIETDLCNGQAANGLSELITSSSRHLTGTIEQSLLRVALAAIKERHTRRGSSQAAFREELEVMLKIDGNRKWATLERVLDNASRR